MNKWIGIGRLTADPEFRCTQSGTPVATYRIAIDRIGRQGEQTKADFINCVAWKNNAEFARKYLTKGTKIAIEGRIQTRSYTDRDGKTVYITEIVVERHEFCESKKAEKDTAAVPWTDYDEYGGEDDELPF